MSESWKSFLRWLAFFTALGITVCIAWLIIGNYVSWPPFTEFMTAASLIAWITVALLFFYDSLRVHVRAEREAQRVSLAGAGVVANRRARISFWFLQGSGTGLIVGLISAFRVVAYDPATWQAQLMSAVVRFGVVYMFFCFWRAKRTNLNLYREAEKRHAADMEEITGSVDFQKDISYIKGSVEAVRHEVQDVPETIDEEKKTLIAKIDGISEIVLEEHRKKLEDMKEYHAEKMEELHHDQEERMERLRERTEEKLDEVLEEDEHGNLSPS